MLRYIHTTTILPCISYYKWNLRSTFLNSLSLVYSLSLALPSKAQPEVVGKMTFSKCQNPLSVTRWNWPLSVGAQGPLPRYALPPSLGSPWHLTLSVAEASSTHTHTMSHNSLHLTVLFSHLELTFLLIFWLTSPPSLGEVMLKSKSCSLLQVEPGSFLCSLSLYSTF